MRLTWTAIAATLLLLSILPSQAFERYYVIKVTDFDGNRNYQVLSQDELKVFEKSLRTEGRVFSKAYSQTKKEWQSNEETKKITFPSLRPRRFSKSGTYDERSKATEKVQYYAESSKKSAAEKKKQQSKNKGKKLSKEDQAKEKVKQEKRRALEASAYEMVVSKINSMLSEQGVTPIAQPVVSTTTKGKGKGKGGAVQATITGKIKKAGKTFYLSANEGQLVNGLKPWGIDLPATGMKDTMVGKEATITFAATGTPRGDQIKVTGAKVSKMTFGDNDAAEPKAK